MYVHVYAQHCTCIWNSFCETQEEPLEEAAGCNDDSQAPQQTEYKYDNKLAHADHNKPLTSLDRIISYIFTGLYKFQPCGGLSCVSTR